jgi:D-alanine-D-alanine ligase
MKRHILIAHDTVAADAPEEQQDVRVAAGAVEKALRQLGYSHSVEALGGDIVERIIHIRTCNPWIVFNLVESLDGINQRQYIAPLLFERCALPYTGSGPKAQLVTTDKLIAKSILQANGLPTPPWQHVDDYKREGCTMEFPVIVKPVAEDASVGISNRAVCTTEHELNERVNGIDCRDRAGYFIERYVDGREWNVSILGMKGRGVVLPPAEILFVDYPPAMPHIVGYNAKWLSHSAEFMHTVRTFTIQKQDIGIAKRLEELACRCWDIFGLKGYARVDFRIDVSGTIWVLEINANPCIAPDSGFVAAADASGLQYTTMIQRIINEAVWNGSHTRQDDCYVS